MSPKYFDFYNFLENEFFKSLRFQIKFKILQLEHLRCLSYSDFISIKICRPRKLEEIKSCEMLRTVFFYTF